MRILSAFSVASTLRTICDLEARPGLCLSSKTASRAVPHLQRLRSKLKLAEPRRHCSLLLCQGDLHVCGQL